MSELLDFAAWRELLVRTFSELGASVAGFLPKLVGAAAVLLVGWILSRLLEFITARTLRGVRLDGAATRLGIADLLSRAGISLRFSQIVAKLVFWLVMLTFVQSSAESLGLASITATIDRLVGFIPGVIGAALIGIGGLLLGRFVATLVSSAARAGGILSAARLGFLAQIAVAGLVLVVAAEQLGLATSVLVLPLTVALAGAGFAVGLAFALGARPVITHIMAGHFLKQSLPRDTLIEIDGRRGFVERVGAVDTLLRSEEREWTIPNGQLLNRVVVRGRQLEAE